LTAQNNFKNLISLCFKEKSLPIHIGGDFSINFNKRTDLSPKIGGQGAQALKTLFYNFPIKLKIF